MPNFRILSTHASIDVHNLEEGKKYLEKTLGLEKLRELTRPQQGTIVWYPGLELSQAEPGAKVGIVKHVAWQVDDIHEAIRVLKETGFTFETEDPRQIDVELLDTKEIVKFIFFETPLGFRGELFEANPRTFRS